MENLTSEPDQSQFNDWRISDNDNKSERPKYEPGQIIGKGRNSVVYEIKGNENLVMVDVGGNWGGVHSTEWLQKSLESADQEIELYKKIPQGVQAPKILDSWIENGKLYKLMEKAIGKPVHNREGSFKDWQNELQEIADATIKHYQKLISDIKKLHTVGLQADPSKPDNFYYDPETGFHLIDLDPGEYLVSDDLIIPLINTVNLFNSNRYKNMINNQVRQSIKIILEKLSIVGNPPSQNLLEQINEAIQ